MGHPVHDLICLEKSKKNRKELILSADFYFLLYLDSLLLHELSVHLIILHLKKDKITPT